ncbi:MAG: archaellin/type IV pilin N-terminal domain-containing protein [Dehalococcoidia bacterium]
MRTLIKSIRNLGRGQRGITGLETAIILIAFVVVASVFAYTVLSAGIFSSEKGKEAVHSGLKQARGSMEILGSVKATGVLADTIDNADAAWTAATNVTVTTDTTDKKEGTASVEITIAAAFATGTIAYKNLGSAVDISDHYSVRLWIKSSTTTAANVYRLLLDDTAGCGSPLETLSISEALTANTWTQVQLDLSDPSALTAVACVGLDALSDPGTPTLNIDLVEAPGEVTQVHFVVTNALGGEPIDLTTTTDTDSDGLLSDESSPSHVVTISYTDKYQRVSDLAWTKTAQGKNDSDNLLESGEKFLITVDLKALNPMPVSERTFTISVKAATGATLVIERTLPAYIDTAMDLN